MPEPFSITVNDEEINSRLSLLAKFLPGFANKRLAVGTNVGYMRKHQLGLGVPTRKFLGVAAEDKREIQLILKDAIKSPPTDPDTPWREIGEYMLLATDTRWEQEVDPDGVAWTPNTPYTIRMKQERGQIQKILQASGRARRSITYQVK